MQKYFLTFLMLIIVIGQGRAQNYTARADSIDEQFENLLNTSPDYKDNKVVKRHKIIDLRNNTHDQIVRLEKETDQLKKEISEGDKKRQTLHRQLQQTEDDLQKTKKEKEYLSLLGLNFQKSTYQAVVLAVVVILVLLLLIVVYNYLRSQRITREARQEKENLANEYDEYRKKALETQQKLGRKLQDERNKNKNNPQEES